MRKILLNLLIFGLYFIYEYIAIVILQEFGINYTNLDLGKKAIISFLINLLFILLLLFVYKKELKKDAIDFKDNYKKYISTYIIYYVVGIILMGASNVILQHITNLKISGNESAVRELISVAPLYMFFSTVIYAPYVEELIFRKSIRNIVKNKYLFIIISGFIFGILHIIDFKNYKEILMGIPYIIMGIDFAYIYYKSNNIFTTMTLHIIHNLILFTITLL